MESPRQLEMRREHLTDLPEVAVPERVELRTYRAGDEEHWARIMNQCIGEGWTSRRCRAELLERPEFTADGCFFAVADGMPVGSATAWRKAHLAPETGYIHMVGVAREARGRRLGRALTLAVLHWFRERGYRRAILHTDDWRLAAIATYFRLGFEPFVFDEAHAKRWEAVRKKVAMPDPLRSDYPGDASR